MLLRFAISGTLIIPLLTGCATLQQASEAPGPLPCAIAGGVIGGVAGAIIAANNASENPLGGFAIGSASGVAVGGAICLAFARKNLEPVAGVSGGPFRGTAPLSVDLRAIAQDLDGEIAGYAWDLGDGARSTADSLSHTYRNPGQYTAQLTVMDDRGLTATDSVLITVEAPVAAPPPVLKRRVALSDMHFDFDSSALRAEADAILQELLNELRDDPSLRVRISGYTDTSGQEIYNQGLSEARAASVALYLGERGINASRVESRGFGPSNPIADNATREGRKQNRRVELEIFN